MNENSLAGLTIYNDLRTILQEKGLSDAEIAEMIMKLTAQIEYEVTEEMMGRLTEDQKNVLDTIPEGTTGEELANKLGLNGDEINVIRAEKAAQIIKEFIPSIDQED